MRTATLIRSRKLSGDAGTFGRLQTDTVASFVTGELPWRNNENGLSCIPTGTYVCKWFDSPKHGWLYLVTGVPSRDMIEIHSANFLGDRRRGYKCELLGCIALGEDIGTLDGQMAVLKSKIAVAEFDGIYHEADIELTIKWDDES